MRSDFELVGAAEGLRAKVGAPRPPALETELANHLAGARASLGEEQADAAVARGQAWSLDEALTATFAAFEAIPSVG